jgi:hypothetical protein
MRNIEGLMLQMTSVIALLCLLALALAVPSSAQGTGNKPEANTTPQLLLLDGASLARVRASLQAGETTYRPALEKLKEDADKSLKAGPYSVTSKGVTPPSGDKHDYMSMGTYWWPDPTKPDGLPYIRKDGQTSPEVRKITDTNYMGQMSSNTQTLALAYYFTGEEKFAAHAAKLLKTWFLDPATRMNPHLNYAQAIPGITQGRGIGIIDTERLLTIPDSVALLSTSQSWTSDDKKALQQWFDEYLTWLLESKNGQEEAGQRNNHGTIYDAQVAAFALFVGKPDVARKTLEQSAEKRIAREITPDGRQPLELARTKGWTYSTKNLDGLMILAQLGQHAGIDLWNFQTPDGRSIKAALDWMRSVANGTVPWTYKEIGHTESWKPKVSARILLRAERAWPAAGYGSVLDAETTDNNNRLNLLWPRFKTAKP